MPKKKVNKKTARGKAIAAHQKKHGDSADWKKNCSPSWMGRNGRGLKGEDVSVSGNVQGIGL